MSDVRRRALLQGRPVSLVVAVVAVAPTVTPVAQAREARLCGGEALLKLVLTQVETPPRPRAGRRPPRARVVVPLDLLTGRTPRALVLGLSDDNPSSSWGLW